MMKIARLGTAPIAAAIFFVGEDALYGRYWGAGGNYHSLHFETCYYQGIEYCIERGLARFEPGTQGEHKVPRGFVPTMMSSAHYIDDPRFAAAIRDFAAREARGVARYAAAVAGACPLPPFGRRGVAPLSRLAWLAATPESAPIGSLRSNRRCAIRRACSRRAAICVPRGYWPPTNAGSSHGIRAQQPILWWAPDPRMVLFPSEFNQSRSLRKTIRNKVYETRVDSCVRRDDPRLRRATPLRIRHLAQPDDDRVVRTAARAGLWPLRRDLPRGQARRRAVRIAAGPGIFRRIDVQPDAPMRPRWPWRDSSTNAACATSE